MIANQNALKHPNYTDCNESMNVNGGLEDKEEIAQTNCFIMLAMPLELFMEFYGKRKAMIKHMTSHSGS